MSLLAEAAWAHDSGFGLARYAADGTLDKTFGSNGIVVVRSAQRSFVANALAVQPDAKILLAGMSSDVSSARLDPAIARYTADGTADQSFSTGGTATTPVGDGGGQANAVVLQSDGMILVAGTAFGHGATSDEFVVGRFTSAGARDTGFGSAGTVTTHVGAAAAAASALAVQPDGRIIVVGSAFSNGATDDDFAVVRYTASGVLDPEFGNAGIATTDFSPANPGAGASLDRAGAVALQSDGKIVVGGFTRGKRPAFAVARYMPNGSLDAGFGRGGKVLLSAAEPQVFSLVLQPGGEIVLAGSSAADNGATPFTLVRLRSDGSPDTSFGDGGVAVASLEGSRSGARSVVTQPDGKLIAGGAKFGAPSAQGDPLPESGFALARYNVDGTSDTSFGSNGQALTTLGDAGATLLSLGVQPDGKILAAGLVFFQVPSTPAPWGQVSQQPVILAGVVLVLAAMGVALSWRRGKKARR
jgi:uncharacterized delta-60 repeat protein